MVDSLMAPPATPVASASTNIDCKLASFRERCKLRKVTLFPRLAPRKLRKKRTYPSVVRRSSRVAGRFVPGTLIKQQQKTLMIHLGITREGR
jgi:hypothetical protein